MSEVKFIHCEEIAVDPLLITLGDIEVDIAKISAYSSIRVIDMLQRISEGTAKERDAVSLIADIVREQHPEITEDTILKSGNHAQFSTFVQEIVKHTIRTYAPLQRGQRPFSRPEGVPETETGK